MFERIKRLLFSKEAAKSASMLETTNERDIVTALLIQAALIDGHFADEERATIIDFLMRDHGASADEAATLIDEITTKVRKSSQMFRLTTAINENFDLNKKISLMETLWEVTLADRVINKYENNLMIRLAGLLHVTDQDNAEARKRVLNRFTQT